MVTESGLKYKLVRKGEGPKPIDGDIVLFNITYVNENNEIIFSTENQDEPVPIAFNSQNYSKNGSLEELFGIIENGDSVLCEIGAKDLFTKTFKTNVPDSINSESTITFFLGVKDVMSNLEYKMRSIQKRNELANEQLKENPQMGIDTELIDQHLSSNNIVTNKTQNGVRYQILKEGKGNRVNFGEKVKIIYTGKILDGQYFDSNDSIKAKEIGIYKEYRPYAPYEFALGFGEVIMGWDDVISYFRPGTEAIIYIPSPMAYGSNVVSEIIKENSVLVFNVEIVEVSDNE